MNLMITKLLNSIKISTFFALLSFLVISLALAPFAKAETLPSNRDIIICGDNSWIIVKTVTTNERGNSKTFSRSYEYYENNIFRWSATLTGSFTYDGVTSTCTSSNLSFFISNSAWYVVSQYAYRSGNTAYGDYTMGARILGITYKTTSFNMSISCDKDGNVS